MTDLTGNVEYQTFVMKIVTEDVEPRNKQRDVTIPPQIVATLVRKEWDGEISHQDLLKGLDMAISIIKGEDGFENFE